jgi:hypothetical protein
MLQRRATPPRDGEAAKYCQVVGVGKARGLPAKYAVSHSRLAARARGDGRAGYPLEESLQEMGPARARREFDDERTLPRLEHGQRTDR